MKDLHLYLKETAEDGKNGHYEEFADEDTGEIVTMWVDDKPAEIVKAVKEATPEELQKLKDMRKKYDDLDDKYWTVKNDLTNLQQDLRDMKSELRELQYGMEDEIGGAETDAERDRLGNKYGAELEKLQTKMQKVARQIEAKAKQKEALQEKVDRASMALWKYEDKIGYHINMSGKIVKY